MTHRRADVYLDPTEPRCPCLDKVCTRKMTCARYLAEINGSPVEDFSMKPWVFSGSWVLTCPFWMAVERQPASAGPAPTVHKSVRGLS